MKHVIIISSNSGSKLLVLIEVFGLVLGKILMHYIINTFCVSFTVLVLYDACFLYELDARFQRPLFESNLFLEFSQKKNIGEKLNPAEAMMVSNIYNIIYDFFFVLFYYLNFGVCTLFFRSKWDFSRGKD